MTIRAAALLEGMATRFGYDVICAEGGDVAVAALTAQGTRIVAWCSTR